MYGYMLWAACLCVCVCECFGQHAWRLPSIANRLCVVYPDDSSVSFQAQNAHFAYMSFTLCAYCSYSVRITTPKKSPSMTSTVL